MPRSCRSCSTTATKRGPSARSCSPSKPGTRTAPRTSLRATPSGSSKNSSRRCARASANSKRRTRNCAKHWRNGRKRDKPGHSGAQRSCEPGIQTHTRYAVFWIPGPALKRRPGMTSPMSEMSHDAYPDSYIRGILNTVKTIAMVGFSPKENRPSYFAFKYLLERGYRMIPVNPGHAGKQALGQPVYAKLSDIPDAVDMIDIFRSPQYASAIVDEALK